MISNIISFKWIISLLFVLILFIFIIKFIDMSNVILKIGYQLYIKTPFGPLLFKHELKKANEQFKNSFHSSIKVIKYGIFNVTIIPYSLNNYGYIIWHSKYSNCILIDPGYAAPFKDYLIRNSLIPKMILVTHKHHDHCYGLKELAEAYPDIEVVGSVADRTRFTTKFIRNEKEYHVFSFNLNEDKNESFVKINALLTPGHTLGHVTYLIKIQGPDKMSNIENNYALYFTGDTIFTGSIGRMFECTASVYFKSIQLFIESLLDNDCKMENIFLFPGHEYSIINLTFILNKINVNNENAKIKLASSHNKRKVKEPTIPIDVLEELSFNPFLEIVLADNTELQSALSTKFGFTRKHLNINYLLKTYSLTKIVRKRIGKSSPSMMSVNLFKEIRRLRDNFHFNE